MIHAVDKLDDIRQVAAAMRRFAVSIPATYYTFITCPLQLHGSDSGTYSPSLLRMPTASLTSDSTDASLACRAASAPASASSSSSSNRSFARLSNSFGR